MTKVRLPEQRAGREVMLMRERLEQMLAQASTAEKVRAGIKSPFWTDYLQPLITAQAEGLSEKNVIMEMDPKDFAKAQNTAKAFDQLLERVMFWENVDPAEIKKDAQALLDRIEKAERDGIVPKELVDEG